MVVWEGGQVNVERKRCMGEVRKGMMEREKKEQPGRERKNHTAIELIWGKIIFVRGLL